MLYCSHSLLWYVFSNSQKTGKKKKKKTKSVEVEREGTGKGPEGRISVTPSSEKTKVSEKLGQICLLSFPYSPTTGSCDWLFFCVISGNYLGKSPVLWTGHLLLFLNTLQLKSLDIRSLFFFEFKCIFCLYIFQHVLKILFFIHEF